MINRAFAFQPGLLRAAIGLAGLVLFTGGCGGPDPSSSDSAPSSSSSPPESSATADDGNRNGNGNGNGNGGIAWPSLPDGPEIPEYLEIHAYSVLAKPEASRCAALLSPAGVEVQVLDDDGRLVATYVVSLSTQPVLPEGQLQLPLRTGDRTRYLYEAGAHLCAGDETAAKEAFAAAVSLGSWSTAAPDADTQWVVCTVWDTVVRLLDPSAGACTLEVATTDDGDADPTDDATQSAGPSATADESDAAADDGVSESDAADATDAP